MTHTPPSIAAAVAIAALAAGCGSSSNDGGSASTGSSTNASSSSSSPGAYGRPQTTSSGGGGSKLALAANPTGALKFDKTSLSARAGTVTVVMRNPSGTPHAISIEGHGVDEDGATVTNGGTSKVSAKLKPGRYEFYCPVDHHEEAGMKGTLIVR